MGAGHELDVLIAEKVMGMIPFRDDCLGDGWHSPDWNKQYYVDCAEDDLPHFSTDIAAAWQVVGKMRELGFVCTLRNWIQSGDWEVTLSNSGVIKTITDNTAPLAICRAALEAING